MVVICAGTTGYNVTLDLRYHWMRQKRFQGSHLSNDEQAAAVTELVAERQGRSRACRRPISFDDIPECHQLMLENKHPLRQHGRAGQRAEGGTRRRRLLRFESRQHGQLKQPEASRVMPRNRGVRQFRRSGTRDALQQSVS